MFCVDLPTIVRGVLIQVIWLLGVLSSNFINVS
jgi:hypothetical protein